MVQIVRDSKRPCAKVSGSRTSGFAAVLKQEANVGQQDRLVVFDGEQVVGGALFDQVAGKLALGEQGIGGDGLAGDVHTLEQGNEHPDLVGLFERIGAVYGQGSDFFWV